MKTGPKNFAPALHIVQQGAEIVLRRLAAASDRLADRIDHWGERFRRRFLRLGWVFDVLLGLAIAEVVLALWERLPAGLIHSLAGLGLICLALRIGHTALVLQARQRGEL